MADANFNAQEVLQFTIQLAKDAGEQIRLGRQKLRDDISGGALAEIVKKNTADLVTETDQATENLVKERIAKTYPTYKFIGEESWAAGEENKIGDEPTFICDPIDGTTNFVNGFPFCCISIGLTYRKELTLGVVYAPFLDRLYTGLKGHGSFLITPSNGTPQKLPLQQPLPLPSLRQATIALEWGSARDADIVAAKAKTMEKLCSEDGKMVQGIRSIGSAAMSCCFVAEGCLALYSEVGCWAWDVAAGWLIANEAGGLTVGAKAPTQKLIKDDAPELGKVTPEILQGRKYIVVRAIGDTPDGKTTGRQQQVNLLEEFFDAFDEWEA